LDKTTFLRYQIYLFSYFKKGDIYLIENVTVFDSFLAKNNDNNKCWTIQTLLCRDMIFLLYHHKKSNSIQSCIVWTSYIGHIFFFWELMSFFCSKNAGSIRKMSPPFEILLFCGFCPHYWRYFEKGDLHTHDHIDALSLVLKFRLFCSIGVVCFLIQDHTDFLSLVFKIWYFWNWSDGSSWMITTRIDSGP